MAQRRHARFVNTTMMVTGLGAAVSDTLDDGRVVSGVGGQYNFVAMAHALPEARSILCVRATRESRGEVTSSMPWSYGNATIPRHLRDIVVTRVRHRRPARPHGSRGRRGAGGDHGLALPGAFVAEAQRAGKLPRDYRVPDAARNNTRNSCENDLRPGAPRAVRGPAVRQRHHAGRGRAREGAARAAGRDAFVARQDRRGAARAACRCDRRRNCARIWRGWGWRSRARSASACSAGWSRRQWRK